MMLHYYKHEEVISLSRDGSDKKKELEPLDQVMTTN